VPVPDADSAPYWAALREHHLTAQRCLDCGLFRFPPQPLCHRCGSWGYEWEELAGTGAVHSWVTVHHAVTGALKQQVPYIVALIDLDEGIRIPSNVVEIPPDQMREALRVQVDFRDIAGGYTLPVFRATD
jgi:hypothetical protein